MSSAVTINRLRGEVGEVLARHAARDGTDFTRYADDPVGFMRDVLHFEPWSAQVRMAEMIRDHSRVCIVGANSVGKDAAIGGGVALWWVYARRGLVIFQSATDRQARRITMKELAKAWTRSDLPGELYQMELRVTPSSGVLAFTSDDTERLVGFHHPRLLVALSEGQALEAGVFEAAYSCATSAASRIVAYGNPTRSTGPFHACATSPSWETLTIPASEHPNIVSGREEIPGGPSRAWVDAMREEYGATSSVYRARVLAEFPEDSVEGLIQKRWLLSAYALHGVDQGVRARPVIGVDVARFGPDASVAAVVRGADVTELVSWRGASLTESAARVVALVGRVRRAWMLLSHAPNVLDALTPEPVAVAVDEPGLGGGLIDALRAKGQGTDGFNGAQRPSDAARFANLRAESYWHLRTLLERGAIGLPCDPDLEEEALAVEWSINPRGLIQIASKDALRATLGRSPDKLDAVVIACWYGVPALQRSWRQAVVVF